VCARLTGVVSQQPKLTNVQSASARQDAHAAGSTPPPPLLVDVGTGAGARGGGVTTDAGEELTGSSDAHTQTGDVDWNSRRSRALFACAGTFSNLDTSSVR
jgi:hypothetical protein